MDSSSAFATVGSATPADPMDWPLPCDVTVGHGTIRKGCKLRTLVTRMQVLYDIVQRQSKADGASVAPGEAFDDAYAQLIAGKIGTVQFWVLAQAAALRELADAETHKVKPQ